MGGKIRRKLGFFPSPRAYIEGERSEFFQVPESREKLESFM